METPTKANSSICSSIVINSMVNGLSGISLRVKRAVVSDASPFQKIEVFDTYGFGRVLCLADIVVLTERDEFIYHEAIVHPVMMMHAEPSKVCIIGGGDGGCLRETMKYSCVKAAAVVEIDQLVKETSVKHFPELATGFSDPRARVVIADGFSFLDTATDQFDVIIVDSFDPGGPVQSLETMGFYRLVSSHLNKGGIAVFQTDSPTIKSDSLQNTLSALSAVFKAYQPYVCTLPSFPEGICSFCVCAHESARLKVFDAKRFSSIAPTCRYYNADIHRGAFLLPEYIRKCMGL